MGPKTFPVLVGDNPATPGNCPVCNGVVESASVNAVHYVCGGTYAPVPGKIPQEWGGQCGPVETAAVAGKIGADNGGANPPANQVAASVPQAWRINPGPHQQQLKEAIKAQVRLSLRRFLTNDVNDPLPIEDQLTNDLHDMLTSGSTN